MSKSKNNGVDPQDLIEKYGADTARLYTMFTAPPEATLEWNDSAVEGSYRFLRRVWAACVQARELVQAGIGQTVVSGSLSADMKAVRREVHLALKQVAYDYERMQYNTVVSGCMKMLNAIESAKFETAKGQSALAAELLGILLRSLYPATPHIAHQLWAEMGYGKHHGDILDAPWPKVDEGALAQDEVELMLQINGKLRGSILVATNAPKDAIERLALAHELVQKQAAGGAIKRVIIVPGRLVNVVL